MTDHLDDELIRSVLLEMRQHDVHPQVAVLFSLIIFEAVLSEGSLKALLKGDVECYKVREVTMLEFRLQEGWIDRRSVGPNTLFYLNKNGGTKLDHNTLRAAEKIIAAVLPDVDRKSRWSIFIARIKEFWKCRLPGVLFAHCTGEIRFQLLNKHCLWRGLTLGVSREVVTNRSAISVSLIGTHSETIESVKHVVDGIRSIVARRLSKEIARESILDLVERTLPIARCEGRAQWIAISSLKEVIQFGGVRAKVLAPLSIIQYVGLVLVSLVKMLLQYEHEDDPDVLFCEYQKIVNSCTVSQRPKAAAALQAIHNRLTLRGMPQLAKSLSLRMPQVIPSAGFIWPHELQLAKEFVEGSSDHPRIKKQAALMIELGFEVPLRPYEYFELRLVDVLSDLTNEVKVAPRRSSAKDKSLNSHLRHEILSPRLITSLQEHKSVRMNEEDVRTFGDASSLFFLGLPGRTGAFAVEETISLTERALRWATGDSRAVVYDLRHTSITRKASAALSTSIDSDLMVWEQLSRACGHGDVSATRFYVHSIEQHLSKIVHAQAFPEIEIKHVAAAYSPINLEDLFVATERESISDVCRKESKSVLDSLDFNQVNRILSSLSAGNKSLYIQTAYDLAAEDLERIVKSACDAWIDASRELSTLREQRIWLQSQHEFAKASHQEKYSQLTHYLQSLVEQDNWSQLRQIYRIGCICVSESTVDMTRGASSWELLNLFREAGYLKTQLVIRADSPRSIDASAVRQQVCMVLPQQPRRGRPKARFFVVPFGVDSTKASGATISVAGVYWLMSVLGVLLWVRGER